ncbi:MAG: DUF2585 family protein [Planctomycetota bacterium]|nr:DUF2585 family protein [Planctomycetota bacterium]MDA1211340.1 DUF2585 family protein [Planctomycetota bacterium]
MKSLPFITEDRRTRARPWIALAVVLILVTAQLRLQHRLWWCACGERFLWATDVNSRHCSQHLIDPYAFTHVLHGVLLWWALLIIAPKMRWQWKLWWCIALEGLWEIVENTPFVINRYREGTAALGYEGDSIFNSLGDTLSCGLGFYAAYRLGVRKSIALFVATEIVLLFWIRDNLTLNVVMLLWPIETIKHWQLGV